MQPSILRCTASVVALVGSANFTRGGLGKNVEAAVKLTGLAAEPALSDLLSYTKRSAAYGEPVTKALAEKYRAGWTRANRLPKAERDPLEGTAGRVTSTSGSSRLVRMSWDQYVRAVHAAKYHDVDESLELLRIAQTWLASVRSFRNLSIAQRKALAGVIGQSEKTNRELGRNWASFGSMRGMGDFANRVRENDVHLARVVDSIPQKGEVTEEHFVRFSELSRKAFENSDRVGGVPTASRLLAMKRPDVFLCISKPNLDKAAEELSFAKSTLRLDSYWQRVIEVIQSSDWYNAKKPEGDSGELWEGRAAMLDTILYDP